MQIKMSIQFLKDIISEVEAERERNSIDDIYASEDDKKDYVEITIETKDVYSEILKVEATTKYQTSVTNGLSVVEKNQ